MWVLTHQIFFTYLRRKIPQYLEALSHVQLLMLSLKCLTKCWLDRFIKTSSQVGTRCQYWDNAAINNMDQYFHGGKHYTSDGFKDYITLSYHRYFSSNLAPVAPTVSKICQQSSLEQGDMPSSFWRLTKYSFFLLNNTIVTSSAQSYIPN